MKQIALINDISGFGRCSLGVAIPVISVMGMHACPLPTAVLTAQSEFDTYHSKDLTENMDCFIGQWKKMGEQFDGIYSGYMSTSAQIEKMTEFLDCFQKEGTYYLADPVMGDQGKPYDMFQDSFLEHMRHMILRADVITPNLTELCLLTGKNYEELVAKRGKEGYLEEIEKLCRELQDKTLKSQVVIVTGIIREQEEKEYVGNLAVLPEKTQDKKDTYYIETLYTGKSFSGTGDLFASVVCGSMMKGLSAPEAVKKATLFLQEAIKEASEKDYPTVHGVHFEKYLCKL